MALLNVFKFIFAINQISESDLKDIGIPNDLCKDVLILLNKREN